MPKVTKAPTRLGAPKKSTEAFALGTRPASLRGKTPENKPKASNTRDYGTKTPPAVALQPGNPIGGPAPAPGPVAPGINGV